MKKHLLKISSLFLSGIISWGAFAQSQQTGFLGTHNQEKCAFDQKHNELMQNPEYSQRMQDIENIAQQYINSGVRNETVYTIPVVVHVLHDNDPIGIGSNISVDQINSCITHLNQVYRGQLGGIDMGVEFQLASTDPNCQATTGILRYDASVVSGYSANGLNRQTSNGASQASLQALAPGWPETAYFNIWIVTQIDGNQGGSGIQGYANFYSGGSGEGSFMMHTVFGYDPDGSEQWGYQPWGYEMDNSTPVHEFGHYFHLYHTFQGDDANAGTDPYLGYSAQCPNNSGVGDGSDGCADTEVHMRETSTCPSANNSCTSAPYSANVLNNWMSYYSCTNLFTNDQKTRVRSILETSMNGLVTSKGLGAPPAQAPNTTAASCSPGTIDPGTLQTGAAGGIMEVSFKDVIATSSYGINDITSGYSDANAYVDKSQECVYYATLSEGETFDISVSTWLNNHNVHVFVDWNNNGIFDSGEQELALTANTAHPTENNWKQVSGQITVPASAMKDQFLRLRVNADYYTVTSACYQPQIGQVEDYAVYVQSSGPSCNLTLSSTMQESSCSDDDGSIDLTVSNGSSPYTYIWNNAGTTQDLAGLSAASYTVTVTDDNMCEATHTKAVTQNCQPVASTSLTPAYCGITVSDLGDYIHAQTVSGASQYEWEFTSGSTINHLAGFSIRLNKVQGLQYGQTYSVKVRAQVNGIWGSYGNSCNITIPSIPTTELGLGDCNATVDNCESVYCNSVVGATSYEFDVTGPGFSATYLSGTRQFRLCWVSAPPSQTYNVRVRAYVNGVPGNYGNTCTLTCNGIPNTRLINQFCNSTVSSFKQDVRCFSVGGADAYEYHVTDGFGFDETKISSNTRFRLSQVPGVQFNTTYNVEVRARVGGVFGSYGTICTLTTPVARTAGIEDNDRDFTILSSGDLQEISLITYPNPTNGAFTLNLEGLEEYAQTIRIDVFDMYGKQVHFETLYNQVGSTISTINEDGEFANGIYLISVSVDGYNFQQKVVIQ